MEELLAAGTLLLLLLLPNRLAKPGPASAPRPPEKPNSIYQDAPLFGGRQPCSLTCWCNTSSEKLRTNPSESGRSNELHELVVAHVTQKALQAALAFT